jgi:hypothetical protein
VVKHWLAKEGKSGSIPVGVGSIEQSLLLSLFTDFWLPEDCVVSTIIPIKSMRRKKMTESKYDYLKITDIVRDTIYPPFKGMIYYALEKGSDFQIRFTHVSVPFEGKEGSHKHDFDEVFVFVPCDDDLRAYDAETELYIGEEGEKIIIDKTMAVHIPAGLVHCPIIHTRVGTPFFFVNCPITTKYSAIIGEEKVDYPVDKEIFQGWKSKES